MYKYFIIIALFLISCKQTGPGNEAVNSDMENSEEQVEKVLRHIVLFKFKESATESEIAAVVQAFRELPLKIAEIKDFEWGINNSPENINKGFTHCFLLTFQSEEDRAIYLPHPDHKAFGKVLVPILEDVLVVDYWTQG